MTPAEVLIPGGRLDHAAWYPVHAGPGVRVVGLSVRVSRRPLHVPVDKATMPYPPPASMTPSADAAVGAGGPPATDGFPTFESIGVRPLINCALPLLKADCDARLIPAPPAAARRAHSIISATPAHSIAAGFDTGRGSYTAMSGSLTLPEVKAAMDAAGTVCLRYARCPSVAHLPSEQVSSNERTGGDIPGFRDTLTFASFNWPSVSVSGR